MHRAALHPFLVIVALSLFATSVAWATVSITPTGKGLAVDAGGGLDFVLGYPAFFGSTHHEPIHPLIEVVPARTTVTLKYEGGAHADLVIQSDGSIDIRFSEIPRDVKGYTCETYIDPNFLSGGKWRVDDAQARAFPPEKPDHQEIYTGSARSFTIYGADNAGLAFTLPHNSELELADSRDDGGKNSVCRFFALLERDKGSIRLQLAPATLLTAAGSPAASPVQIDRFGQKADATFADKVRSVADLEADAKTESAYYESFPSAKFDRFGGLPGSGERLGLRRSGFFRVQKTSEPQGRWVLVDPDGNAFFHLGVGCFTTPSWTYVAGRQQIYEWLPPLDGEFSTAFIDGKDGDDFSFYNANIIRKYGKPADGTETTLRMIERVRHFGFNSAGPFTDAAPGFQQAGFPYVLGLPDALPLIPGLERVVDPFADGAAEALDKSFSSEVAPLANDPLLIGYFFGNEPIYEDIPRVIPTLTGKQGAKRRLVRLLQEKYGTIERFNAAWLTRAENFADLADASLPVTTPAATADMQAFTGVFLETLFSLVETTFRKYDHHHLLLGYRLQFGTINNEQVCRAMGRHVDVVAFNYYTYGLDQDFLRKIYGWTGERPMLLSEFYWSSPSDSGLQGGIKDVSGQQARGLGYRNYLEQSIALGFVVGVEWFTLIDQSVTGNWFSKYNGENGNTGLFAVTDRPWRAAVEEMVKSNLAVYDVAFGGQPPYSYDNPLFALSRGGSNMLKLARATGPITLDGSVTNWPGLPADTLGSRVVEGPDGGGVSASFKACYDDRNFYVIVNVTDPTPGMNDHDGGRIWMGDAVELFFGHERVDETGSPLPTDRHLLLSASPTRAGGKPAYSFDFLPIQPPCAFVVLPNGDGKGYTLEASIPFKSLGFEPAVGQVIRFDIGLDDSTDGRTRARQIMWNGTARNSSERSGWGRATFIQ